MRLLILWLITILDVALAIALTLSLLDFDVHAARAAVLCRDWSFTSQSGDVAFLAILRLLFVPTVAMWRARRAQREKELAQRLADTPSKPDDVDKDDDADADDDSTDKNEQKTLVSPAATATKLVNNDRTMARLSQSLHAVNRVVLAVLFVFLTACLVFTGLKVLMFRFQAPLFTFQASAMSIAVVLMTLELWLARDVIAEASEGEGRLVPRMHVHPVQFGDASLQNWCDMCDSRINDHVAYTCELCDFGCCLDCFKHASRKQIEHALRGDKGVRDERELSTWAYVKRAFVFVQPSSRWFGVALVVMVLRSIASILLPSFQGAILDSVVRHDTTGFWYQVTLYTSFTVTVMLLSSLQSLCFAVAGSKVGALVKNMLYRSILAQDIEFFDGASTGQLMSRLDGDVWAMMQPVHAALGTAVGSTLQLLGALVMCVSTSFRLSVLAFTTIGPIVLLYRVYALWSRNNSYRMWTAWGESAARATQALNAIRAVRAFSMEPKEIERFEQSNAEVLRFGIMDAYGGMLTRLMSSVIETGVTVLLLVYGGLEAMNGTSGLTVGALITFQLYWNDINNSFQSLNEMFAELMRAAGAAQRVISLLDSLPDIDVHAGATIARDDFRGELELRDVKFTYQMRPDEPVLKGVSLHVEAGKTLALVGRSGGGKSTIVHMLMRFYDPSSGAVLVGGHDLRELCALDYRRHVGVVSQETQLFNGTIAENIAYGVDEYTREELEAAARSANAAEFIDAMDEGYDTKVGENGVRLSGGQRQRIALARVLLRKPQVLLLDEATSALDAESETLVQAAIDRMLSERRCTVVLVAHRLSTVVNADQIAVIDRGNVAELGTHAELLALGGIYTKLVGKQLVKEQNELQQQQQQRDSDESDDDERQGQQQSESDE
jgi:ABC-type multidrug transport system fused ATPase/permease subunit